MAKKSLSELLRIRQKLALESSIANQKLTEIDRELSTRFEAMSVAFGGDNIEPPATMGRGVYALFGGGDSHLNTPPSSDDSQGDDAGQDVDVLPFAALLPHVISILRDRGGGPLRTGRILRELAIRGVTINGKVPSNNLSAHLSNSDFFSNSTSGWLLTERAYPEGRNPTVESGVSNG